MIFFWQFRKVCTVERNFIGEVYKLQPMNHAASVLQRKKEEMGNE